MFGHSHSHGQMQPGHSHQCNYQTQQQQEMPCRLQALFQLHSIFSGNFIFDIIKYIPGIQIILKCYYYTIKNSWGQLSELYLMLNYRITTKIFGTGKFSRLIIGFIQINVLYNILGYSLPTFISIAIILIHLLSNIMPYLKFQLPFLVQNFLNFNSKKIIFIISSTFVLVTYIFCFFSESGFIDANQEKTSFEALMQGRPELNTPQMICPICQIPKICRAVHCPICNQFIEFLNIVIQGAVRDKLSILQFLIIALDLRMLCIGYYFVSAILFILPKNEKYSGAFFSFQNISIFILLLFLIYVFAQETAIELLFACYNITSKEFLYWKKMPYMWKNQEGEFYNPFDQGCKLNLFELAVPKIINRPALIQGNYELVNWYRAKIFTVMDIKSSPFREFIVNQMDQGRNRLPPGMVWDSQTQTLKMDPNMVRQMQAMQQQMMQNPQLQQQMMQQMQQMQQMHQQMQGQQHHQQFEQSEESSLMANQSQQDESTDFLNQEGHDVSLEVQKKEEEAQSLEINFEEEKKQDTIESKQDVQVEIKEEKDTE